MAIVARIIMIIVLVIILVVTIIKGRPYLKLQLPFLKRKDKEDNDG